FFLQAVNFYVESYERIKDLVATYGIENFSPLTYPSGIFAANFRAQTIAENTALKRMSFWQTFSLNLSGLSFLYAFVVSPGGVYLLESIFSFVILFVLLFAGIFGVLLATKNSSAEKFNLFFALLKQVVLRLLKCAKLIFYNLVFLLFSFGLVFGFSELVSLKKESWFIPLYSLIAWLLLLIFGSLFSSFNLHFISLSKKPFKSALASWSKSFLYFTVCLFVFSLVFMVLRIMVKFSLSLTLLTAFLLVFFVFTYFGGLFVILGNGKVYRALKDGFSLVWRNSFEVLIFMLFALLLLILPILISLWITNEQLIILFVIVWGAISMTLLNLFAFEIISKH
ncbi:MAG: hypothetical protein Q8M92_02760, partial [Candidatus Subteraquimicrobiales bacterium]|nr:hypothetical protein [Candidatus Subteraquimicrobiales bacterium]